MLSLKTELYSPRACMSLSEPKWRQFLSSECEGAGVDKPEPPICCDCNFFNSFTWKSSDLRPVLNWSASVNVFAVSFCRDSQSCFVFSSSSWAPNTPQDAPAAKLNSLTLLLLILNADWLSWFNHRLISVSSCQFVCVWERFGGIISES